MALDTEPQPLQSQQEQQPPPPPPQMSMEQDIEYIMHRLTSWGFHRSILALDEELRAMHAAAAPAAAAAAALRSPPPPSGLPPPPPPPPSQQPLSTLPPPAAAAAAAAADRPGFETYPKVPASAAAAAEPLPPMPAHYASVSADIEALEEHLLGVGAADGAAAAEADDEPCFLRIAPRDPRFFEEELWAPDHARPAFARGAGITAEEYRLHLSDVAEEKHRAALQDAVRSFAPEEDEEGAAAAAAAASPLAQPPPTEDDACAVSDCDEADAAAPAAAAAEALSPQAAAPAPEAQRQQQQSTDAFGRSPPPPSAAAPAPAEAAQQVPPHAESHPPAPPQLEKFSLQVIYTKGKTGFEQERNFPMDVNSVIAGRYQILEYIGGAAFSHAVQCLDLKTNHPVCVKIIKNSKDFFDQSLDEIKLLQYINRHGDADEHCVLQLYDYFYYKEHLFLVSELLRENLYEFSKFNRLRGDDLYFTVQRLQKITKQVFVCTVILSLPFLVVCLSLSRSFESLAKRSNRPAGAHCAVLHPPAQPCSLRPEAREHSDPQLQPLRGEGDRLRLVVLHPRPPQLVRAVPVLPRTGGRAGAAVRAGHRPVVARRNPARAANGPRAVLQRLREHNAHGDRLRVRAVPV